jgi:colicin import membrane protein
MKASKVPQKLRKIPPQPVEPGREPFASFVVLSAVVHGVAILCMLGGVWLWGDSSFFKPPSHMVTLVDGPLTLETTQVGGDGKPQGKPSKSEAPGEPGEPLPPPPPALPPVKAEQAIPAPKLPPPPKAVEEPLKEAPKPKVEAPKAAMEAPKKPPEPQTELPKVEPPKEAPKVAETPKKPPEPKVEVPKEEQPPPRGAMTLPKQEPKQPSAAPPPPLQAPPAAGTEAQQAIERLRERQAREAQAQAEAMRAQQQAVAARQAVEQLRERQAREEQSKAEMQAQQQAAEQRLAALRSRFGSGGIGGGTGSGGPGGNGPGGGTGGLGGGLSRIRLQAYQDLVREKVIDAWILPMPKGEARKLQATALLMVSREGQVARLQILQTSGNPLFDDSLLRAIRQASPLPPLPEDYQGAFLEVEMRFRANDS